VGALIVGPVIGYELSDHAARSTERAAIIWTPTVGISGRGATLGAAGSF